MPWYDMPWFVFRLTNRWGWKWLNPTQPAVVALWIIFCSFHSKIQIILSQSYWIMITFDGAMLRCSELPPDVRFLFPGFRDSFSLQGIFCVSLNTVAFPVWWSHGVAFLATYLLLDQRHGIFMLLRTSGLITGARKKWFFIHFIFNVNPLILESFDTWLKMCTVALSFSPSHCLQWIYTDAADAVSFQPWIASETGHSWGGNIFETCLSICKAGDYGLAPEQQKQKKQSTSGCLDIFQW